MPQSHQSSKKEFLVNLAITSPSHIQAVERVQRRFTKNLPGFCNVCISWAVASPKSAVLNWGVYSQTWSGVITLSFYHLMLIVVDTAKWFIWLTLALMLFYVELNSQIRFRLRPDLSSQIWPEFPNLAGFGKVKSGTSLVYKKTWISALTLNGRSQSCAYYSYRHFVV